MHHHTGCTFRHNWRTAYIHKMDCKDTPDWQKPNYMRKQLGQECLLPEASYLDWWFFRFHFYSDLIITLHWFCMSLILTICSLLPHKNSHFSLAQSMLSLSHFYLYLFCFPLTVFTDLFWSWAEEYKKLLCITLSH